MTWDHWEQLKADAAQKHLDHMQLNHLPPDGTGGGDGGQQGDLTANQQDLAAVGDSAFKLFESLGRYGRDAWSSSQTAARDLTTQKFETGGGLHVVQAQWEIQLKSLLDACAHISNHMDFTKKIHQGDEYFISDTVSSISTLDKGFESDGRKS
ncbi:hypothetical protein QR77_14060 [Streptomyces sp. 150FB]|uniref:hypothetical protein n=1 Tax=Streptomyces sp. 150FB TaxID=1576605 RepID=UPI0005892C48|nr:hypothetical protein [Streptomyces sp. 150FB]KIF78806.1 hypothetical protein QR77_14060 [Streptomyces sp. 150FB]